MTLLHRCRTAAVVVLTAGMIAAMPAGAGLMQTEPTAGLATQGAGGALWVAGCDSCSPAMAPTDVPQVSATLSVNMAILVLGSLWLTLMVRRIQMRLGSEGLNGGARPHAAGGH